MKELRKIVLKNLSVPESLPFDFSELKNLRHLDLSGSTNLTTLPNSISQLLQLQHLALRDCINLSIPMHILGKITTLEHIDFKGCAQLVQLPEGISSQRSLRYLNLLETRLTELALNLEPLGKLEQLIIGSASLKELSCSVENLVHLKELILVKCYSLMQIHTPNEQLAYLERLEIYGSSLTHLPGGIALYKHLKVLTIYRSPIENFDFHYMYALTNLTLMHTSISEIIIPPGACRRLEIVDLSDNLQLCQVQVFVKTLVKLNLDGCLSLKSLKLRRLKCLNINGCGCVETLEVKRWRSLEVIRAERCWKLRMIKEEWSQLKQAYVLKFSSFSRKFRWDEVQEKAGSMEKAEYEMMFKSFLRMTFRIELLSMEEHETLSEDEKMGPYLMCFLTRDEGELANCNDFMVRFVYTTATPTESRANETRWTVMSPDKDYIFHYCEKIMAYGTLWKTKK